MFADVSNLFVHEDVVATPGVPQSPSAPAETCVVLGHDLPAERTALGQIPAWRADLSLRAGTVAGR